MPNITFLFKDGTEKQVEAQAGLSLMEVAIQNDIEAIEGACGGGLSCATCHLYVHPDFRSKTMPEDGEVSEDEEDMLDLAFELKPTSRLSCQIIMRDDLDGLVVAVPGAKVEWL